MYANLYKKYTQKTVYPEFTFRCGRATLWNQNQSRESTKSKIQVLSTGKTFDCDEQQHIALMFETKRLYPIILGIYINPNITREDKTYQTNVVRLNLNPLI